jgi:repressor LexA
MSKKSSMQAMVEKAAERRAEINASRDPGPLTKKQGEVLAFIKAHIAKYTFPPTVQEISDAFGWNSQNAAFQHLRLMEKKGAIRREANFSRAITVIE